ncbi:MAG TPA: peptidylprolyl isomerase [Acidimicrobiia bacterium]|nr:peptidylprolyl isomerase [Acidimicrobiia bacterium]
MKKLILLVAAGALLLGACGGTGGGDVAATVNGADVTVEDVRAFPYEPGGTIEVTEFAQYLGALIQWQILDNAAAEEFGVDPTEAEVDAELEQVLTEQAGGATLAEVAEGQNFSEDTVRQIVRVGLIQEMLIEEMAASPDEVADDEVAAAVAEQAAGLTEVCARHILVDTEEEAETAKQRLEDGEEFATVAGELSTDPSVTENGGDLGCALAQQYVAPFRDAAVAAELDTLTDPVGTEYGFHIIEVYDRTEPEAETIPSEEEVRSSLAENSGVEALQAWLTEVVGAADVTVNEEYGTWTLEPQPGVQPPTG